MTRRAARAAREAAAPSYAGAVRGLAVRGLAVPDAAVADAAVPDAAVPRRGRHTGPIDRPPVAAAAQAVPVHAVPIQAAPRAPALPPAVIAAPQLRAVPLLSTAAADVSSAKAADHRVRRRAAFTAVASSFGLAASLIIAGPAQAAVPHASDAAVAGAQALHVGGDVVRSSLVLNDYSANASIGLVAAAGDNGGHDAAVAVADALNAGGERATIVRTALEYFGDPYVLGGASHDGIDCSGLTMLAYAAVGIGMAHYVPTQDAMGVQITQAEALPGDLVVFDNEEHIGIYLGNGMVLHAPATGRSVSIEAVSVWQSVGIHFTRILSH
jgi:Cell wall-associated hydrolases (invasion-associated proteins)